MKKALIVAALCCASCGQSDDPAGEVDIAFDNTLAAQTLKQVTFNLSALKVHAVCGPSSGKGLFEPTEYAEFETDGITNGRIIFVSGADDTGPNLIFRDASGTYISSLQEGTKVELISPRTDSSGQMWIVSDSRTGVVESHNIFVKNGRLVDLWTSNKPSSVLGSPSAKLFFSNCIRP